MRVLMFFRVALMFVVDLLWGLDVVRLGAGHVERSSVGSIMIL
jgi:hypothetical protein